MTAEQWTTGRNKSGLTQVAAARTLNVSQPYLSQLETGLRVASVQLARKATRLYKLSPTALPLPEPFAASPIGPDELQNRLASLGYPGFEHLRIRQASNPAEVVLGAVVQRDLDTRLVEALPWVLKTYTDLNWGWLRDRVKLENAQNRLGYLVHLARDVVARESAGASPQLTLWENELEQARLASEGTLCRDSMREPERKWLRSNRSADAAHWNLLTGITAEQLPYANN
jgi:transcriptional regulator with XRE-family HTH domain